MLARPGKVYAFGSPSEVLTQENITEVYGVNCRIIDDVHVSEEDPSFKVVIPHIILDEALMDRAD